MNELNKHKKRDGIKWVATLLAILLLAVGVTAGITKGFKDWNPYGWFDKQAVSNGGAVLDNIEENGVVVASKKIAPKDYALHGVSAMAETAYALTASVLPSDAFDKAVDWTVAFVNASSEWSTGKTVTDYVTVTPTADGALTANVECKAEFGAQIEVKVSLRNNAGLNATCSVDYKQKYLKTWSTANYATPVDDGMGAYCGEAEKSGMRCPTNSDISFNSNSQINNPMRYTSILSSVYTIPLDDQDITFKYYVKLNPEFSTALRQLPEFSSATLATDWVFVDETTGRLTTATDKSNGGVSGTNKHHIFSYMGKLNSVLPNNFGGPGLYRFQPSTLNPFIRAAKPFADSYHFQVKVIATLGEESFETIRSVYFLASSLTIPVNSISIGGSGGIIF